MKFVPDRSGIAELLMLPGTKDVIRSTTESVARNAAGAATSSAGLSWTVAQPGGTWAKGSEQVAAMRVEFDVTSGRNARRHRGAIIVQHPAPSGRKAGREALRRAVPDPKVKS